MKLSEAKEILKKNGYVLEAYDANRERTYKKYGAVTQKEKDNIDFRLNWKANSGNTEYLRNKYEEEANRNRKSAVPLVDKMMDYIKKKYNVDIWSYDDGYYNPVSGAHYAPKENYHIIKFHCGPDIGREWCIYWYVEPEQVRVELPHKDEIETGLFNYKKYTGKFKVRAFADKEHDYNDVLDEDEIFEFIDKVIPEVANKQCIIYLSQQRRLR